MLTCANTLRMLALGDETRGTRRKGPKEARLRIELATHCGEGTWRCMLDLAGRQGFELGAMRFSKLVMARDFWF